MGSLFEKIRYEDKFFDEVTNDTKIEKVRNLVAKLKPLENEILNEPSGRFLIQKNGIVWVGFSVRLALQISDLILGTKLRD